MITAEDILNMNFYKKEKFTGSCLGMRYLIEKETSEMPAADASDGSADPADASPVKTDCFRVWVWPGPYAFAAADEDVKISAVFPFTEEGRQQVVDWLNEQWAAKKDVWAATMLH